MDWHTIPFTDWLISDLALALVFLVGFVASAVLALDLK